MLLSYIVGFLLVASGDFSTSSLLSGYAAYATATSPYSTDLVASLAVDMDLAYADALGRTADFTTAETAPASVLYPGVYKFTGALGMVSFE